MLMALMRKVCWRTWWGVRKHGVLHDVFLEYCEHLDDATSRQGVPIRGG